MSQWVELGLDPTLYWTLTPRMMMRIAVAARHRLESEHNGRAWLAHAIVSLDRQKRLPRLDTLLIKRRPSRDQTWREQMTVCRAIAAAYGSKPANG